MVTRRVATEAAESVGNSGVSQADFTQGVNLNRHRILWSKTVCIWDVTVGVAADRALADVQRNAVIVD